MLEKLDYSVAICALARDCSEALQINIPKIEELRLCFNSSAVVIVENDSKDATKKVLQDWSGTFPSVTIISKDYNTVTLPEPTAANLYPGTSIARIEKMATYRNIYIDWIENQEEKFDLVIMVDVDVENFSAMDIVESIRNAPVNWGGLFANGFTDTKLAGKQVYTMYYDMYAYAEELPDDMPYFTYAKLFKLKKGLNKKLRAQPFLPVVSAFGGIGIYKAEAIAGIRYRTIPNGDQYLQAVCEHVLFNNDVIKKGYQNFVSSILKVYYGPSENLIVIRNLIPLWLFKTLCLVVKFKKLKE